MADRDAGSRPSASTYSEMTFTAPPRNQPCRGGRRTTVGWASVTQPVAVMDAPHTAGADARAVPVRARWQSVSHSSTSTGRTQRCSNDLTKLPVRASRRRPSLLTVPLRLPFEDQIRLAITGAANAVRGKWRVSRMSYVSIGRNGQTIPKGGRANADSVCEVELFIRKIGASTGVNREVQWLNPC